MKIAIICDWLLKMGGIERIVLTLYKLFPQSFIYTTLFNPQNFPQLKNAKVATSFFQRFSFLKEKRELLIPLLPFLIERFDFSDFDLVISVGPYSKGVILPPHTLHINYCSTPIHYLWSHKKERIETGKRKIFKMFPFKFLANFLRVWDFYAAQRPDLIIANSCYTQRRIKKYYRRSSEVIYPPTDTEFFLPFKTKEKGNFFLSSGRLVDYKKWDILIDAFSNLNLPLKICGDGPLLKNLKKRAKKNIEFLGFVSDEKLKELYNSCKAFVFPSEEDFGLVITEAMACGKPVVVFKGGGVKEIVKEGICGVFFEEQTAPAIQNALLKINLKQYNPQTIRQQALLFSKSRFKKEFENYVQKHLQ